MNEPIVQSMQEEQQQRRIEKSRESEKIEPDKVSTYIIILTLIESMNDTYIMIFVRSRPKWKAEQNGR